MFKKPGRSPTLMSGLILLFIILSGLASPTLANQGVNWLTAQAQLDGHYSTPDDLDIPFIATAETLHTLYEMGETDPSMTAALEAINAVTQSPIEELSTETLAKLLIIGAKASQPVDALTTELLTRLNDYGGFGDLINYDSSVIDTSSALTALAQSENVDTALETLYPTIDLLLKQQQEDGGWADNGNDSSVYLTARSLHALWHYRHQIKNITTRNLIPALDKAQAYLLHELNQGENETFEIALALIAILPRLLDLNEISVHLDTLRAAQLANGSWDNDVYTTALALRTLQIADAPRPNPDPGQIMGTVIDGETGLVLSGINVQLTGTATETQFTNSVGEFNFSKLGPGNYTVQVGNSDLTTDTQVNYGQLVDLGEIHFFRGKYVTAIKGTVTNATTGEPLVGATILVVDITVVTDEQGSYLITDLEPGDVTLQASHDGYLTVSAEGTLTAGATLVFSPQLHYSEGNHASLTGIVVDKATDQPLSGVTVTDGDQTVITNNSGQFNLINVATGRVFLQWSLANYHAKSLGLTLSPFEPSDIGTIALTPNGYQTQVNVRGTVIDASTHQALADVNIMAQFGGTTQTLASNSEGRFDITGLVEDDLNGQFSFTVDGYVSYTLDILLLEDETLYLGQVRLRPEGAKLPDLVVKVNRIHTEPQTFAILGNVTAEVSNIGSAPTSDNIALLSFYDVDLNGVYENDVDIMLGERVVEQALAVEESINVAINLTGSLPFRDAAVKVWVDSLQTVVESDEENNVGSTATRCGIVPDLEPFEPVIKWEWTGSTKYPTYNNVGSAPVVALLEDTNGDGNIDQLDIPSIIFPVTRYFKGSDVKFWAVSGKDGHELWTSSEYLKKSDAVNIAVADIDDDGFVEIIAPVRHYSSIVAFEHTGQLKWQSSGNHVNMAGAVSIADLNGDGSPEIIFGSSVLDASGSLLWHGHGIGYEGKNERGPVSVIADLNQDGKPEIIAGAAAYSSSFTEALGLNKTKEPLWQNEKVGDGFAAIGNFNNDDYPEIVVVSSGKVYLLDHNGQEIWQDGVFISGGGYGGPPTIADMDGDGIPEIGVAGYSRYVVFKADGSVLWETTIQDYSSSSTGSSVFDFNGDGKAEVVYADEEYLRIYRGHDGKVIAEISNTSDTALELPVIADVDNDNHADIVICANFGKNQGIRVFQDKNNNWVNTRKIWNQHSYHITNINDDGTIPTIEQNSWQVHNTYRSQPVLSDSSGSQISDLTAGRLQIIDKGIGQSVTLQVRVGNAGSGNSPPDMPITFSSGHPAEKGTLLGTVMLDVLASGTYQDVQLPGVPLSTLNQEIYAVVDPQNTLGECNEDNNSVSISVNESLSVGVRGIVIDVNTNQALADVNITAQFGQTTQTLTSNATDGRFNLNGSVDNLSGQLTFTLDGYVPYTLDIFLIENEVLDLGPVLLRPEEVTQLLPDLVVKVDNSAVDTGPQTLTVSGNVTAEVSNIGNAATSRQFALLSFYDVDFNDIYDAEVDSVLGEAVIENALAIGESTTVAIHLTGSLPFRDAPIKIWVDNLQTVVESDEKNNVGSTTARCESVTFDPVLKWEWTGSTVRPEYNQVMSTPVVAPLEDTNGDGNINQLDIPSVIFHTLYPSWYNPYNSAILRAVSGKDGHEIWTNSEYYTQGYRNLAVADIDNDGIVEIVTSKPYNNALIAFEHTGEFKWQSSILSNSTRLDTISIADLNSDGKKEIIVGHSVLDAKGTLLWEGNSNNHKKLSIVADIDLDGKLEVINGVIAYSNTGEQLWQNNSIASYNGFAAIGNFNDDNYPEIVVISNKRRVRLLDHNGEEIWDGGTEIPHLGYISQYRPNFGGPPTIADMDGDGIAEMGVAGRNRYAVFKADGAVLWKTPIQNESGIIGSSVFDFEGDGQAEVVYADGQYLRVYRGRDGKVLLETPNTNKTGGPELPVIVDVDNDNHADIVMCANNNHLPSGQGFNGIRVYQDRNNSWANTRKIWNQHSYHITNINDDGTVPTVEQNSWETHNIYRGQPSLGLAGKADLTAGRLKIIDNGIDQPVTLQVRIGNGGAGTSSHDIPITFYAGNPAENGTEIGTVILELFAPESYQDVQLPGVFLSDFNQDIYAVIDAENTLQECVENNNSISTSVKEATPTRHAKVNLTTDAPSYGPNTPVLIDYTITNLGALPADFQVTLRLENVNNAVLESFTTPTLETLASGNSQTFQATWNTGTSLAGPYQIHAIIETAEGELVTEVIHPFTLTAATEGPVVTLRSTTDKSSYHTNDIVLINHLLNNASLNTLIEDALLTLTIKGPDGDVVHTESQALKPLSPQALQNILTPFKLQEAEKGSYTVTVTINGHDDTTLISQTSTFKVENELKFSIQGQVQIDSALLTRGKKQHCTATLTNQGTEKVSGLAVQYLLINLDTQATINTQTATIDLKIGESHTQTLSYDTLSLPITHYACVLQAKIEEDWQPLDFKTFNLHSILSSECSTVYAIHDQARSDTQLFSYDLNNGSIKPLGPLYPERDLEGLDINPHSNQLYASSGQPQSRLEQVNGYSGDLTPIGYIGFQHVTALSFDPLGQLWGAAKGGLIQIDTNTGKGQLIKSSDLKMEGISWNNAGTLLYATAVTPPNPHSSLWVYDPETTELRKHCENLEGEIESLETLPDDRLAFGIHDDQALSFHVYDPEQCQTVQGSLIQTPYNDIEAIAWPSANCTKMQKALQAFFIALSENEEIYLGEDRNLRVSIDGQIYQGQLALEKNQGLPPSDGQLQIIAIPDANEDGIDDFFITYPDGQQQHLYFQGLTSE